MTKRNDAVTKEYLDITLKEKFDKVMGKLDWLIGKYKAHDEKHTLMGGQLSDHNDRLETIEQKFGITP